MQGRVGLKRFIMGVVYDYEAQEFKILEITQRTLMEQLFKYIKDEEYGDPCNYDIKVSKTGKDKDTKYSLIASPPKAASKDLVAEFSELRCDLRAVYDNEDPWAEPTA